MDINREVTQKNIALAMVALTCSLAMIAVANTAAIAVLQIVTPLTAIILLYYFKTTQ